MDKITGSCLCGGVTFECENNFRQFHLCHCVQCQKITGSAHASNLFTNPDNISWLTGIEQIKRFDLPNRKLSKSFCIECGSGVPFLTQSGAALIVPAGCLDGTPNMTPQDNIFWPERAGWYDDGLTAPHFDKFQ